MSRLSPNMTDRDIEKDLLEIVNQYQFEVYDDLTISILKAHITGYLKNLMAFGRIPNDRYVIECSEPDEDPNRPSSSYKKITVRPEYRAITEEEWKALGPFLIEIDIRQQSVPVIQEEPNQ